MKILSKNTPKTVNNNCFGLGEGIWRTGEWINLVILVYCLLYCLEYFFLSHVYLTVANERKSLKEEDFQSEGVFCLSLFLMTATVCICSQTRNDLTLGKDTLRKH